MTRRRMTTAAMVSWWLAALVALVVAGTAAEILRNGLGELAAAAAAAGGAYWLGRRHGAQRGPGRRAATRRLEESARLGLAEELERLAARSLDEITESYRVIARRHRGGSRER